MGEQKSGYFTAERIEEAKAALRASPTIASACAAIGRAWGRRVSESTLRWAFRTGGHGAPSALLNAGRGPGDWTTTVRVPLSAAAEPPPEREGAQVVSGGEPSVDVDLSEMSGEDPEPDPVARRDAQDAAARLRREHKKLVELVRELRARQSFLDEVAKHHAPPRIASRERKSGVREMTPIVAASDWHVEEPIDPQSVAFRNEFDLDIASKRIDRFFDAVIWNVEHHRASGRVAIRDLVLWLGGDLYSGYIHPELVESNALSPTESVLWLLPRLRDGIHTLVEVLDLASIVVPCSNGNHGRSTEKPRVSTAYANSFDWLLYHALASEFKDEPRVRFEITPSAHQYVEVYGETIHFHHGDDVKFAGGIGGLGIPLLKAVPAWDRVRPAAVHVIGHHHTLRDFGRAVVNGSLSGYGPYSQRIRADFEPPQQAMFFWDSKRGKTMMTPLWVGESEKAP